MSAYWNTLNIGKPKSQLGTVIPLGTEPDGSWNRGTRLLISFPFYYVRILEYPVYWESKISTGNCNISWNRNQLVPETEEPGY